MNPRNEHPNPQFVRKNWQNLNGEWDFAFDFGKSGRERGLAEGNGFDKKITVPFCPESELSGIGCKDFISCVWYKRTVTLDKAQTEGSVLLRIGACDYLAEVFVNGVSVGTHKGGYSSFSFDITRFVKEGENTLVICAEDNVFPGMQGSGKQSPKYHSFGCFYTRTTGIWQTVYLEFAPKARIEKFRVIPDIDNCLVTVSGVVSCPGSIGIEAFYEGRPVGSVTRKCGKVFSAELPLSELHLWEAGCGNLYDMTLTFGEDTVSTYFGMRSVELNETAFLLNHKPLFMRLVLDQGFYPDGIYTAKDEATLVRDIELSLAAGFNGARLHEKVFEPRFLYHCDRLGYIVWGEYGNWGQGLSNPGVLEYFLPEWQEVLERDISHPAIVGWCPLNETSEDQRKGFLENVYDMTKQIDPSRPCIDTSGCVHVVTDIFDVHDYTQDPAVFAERLGTFLDTGDGSHYFRGKFQTYKGEPFFMSEYGGIGIKLEKEGKNWSYGNACREYEEFYERYKGLTDVLLDCPRMCGFCYTQLYDVEQEQNGLYTYEREPKFDMARICAINSRKAVIEIEEE